MFIIAYVNIYEVMQTLDTFLEEHKTDYSQQPKAEIPAQMTKWALQTPVCISQSLWLEPPDCEVFSGDTAVNHLYVCSLFYTLKNEGQVQF